MASVFENLVGLVSFPADSDRSLKQYMFVKIDSNGRVTTPSSGNYCDGIQQDKPDAIDRPASVCRTGSISRLVLGGTVVNGATLMSDGNGKGVTCTSGSHQMGKALAAGVSGDVIPFAYQPFGKL